MKKLVNELTARSLQSLATNVGRWPKVKELAKFTNPAEISRVQDEMHALAKRLLAEIPEEKAPIEGEAKEVKE